jgi:alpha-amylase/alpha-mannosidase (GH57 family)
MLKIDPKLELAEDRQIGDSQPVRSLCVHAHFYQPSRENPFTGVIPVEKGAAPYSNWNERIHDTCYRPNAKLGNFERISFNVGPTLFRWMERYDPITYNRIIAQDRANVERFGVGNAMAQGYHHTILPLAARRDKVTQVAWGIADFEHRFGRSPQGIWLPETAADLETLEVLAKRDIEFTILAPWQAAVDDLDPSQPYWVALPSGARIAVFFYHGALSSGVSFDQGMTSNAHDFASKHLSAHFDDGNSEAQLLLLASDGELYGHHQRFRDWFLAYLVNGAGARAGMRLTYPALWLHQHPPRETIQIRENTSWSCHHGVARWEEGCACTRGDSGWKGHLRLALNRLAEALDQIYADEVAALGLDPWQLRNAYIDVILGKRALANLLPAALSADELERFRLLLEAQRERQRMFTSCGWFFESFKRIEPRNNIAYAARAIQLAAQATGEDLSVAAAEHLRKVRDARGDLRGDQVLESFLKSDPIHRATDTIS